VPRVSSGVGGPEGVASEIVTPEAVVLDVERAGLASRTLALAVDVLAIGALWIALFLISLWILVSAPGVGWAVVAIVGSFGLWLAWFTAFETLWQRTPGKAALGLRVVRSDGTPVRFQQAFLRALLGMVELLVMPFIAVVVVLLTPRDQRLGDLVAGTFVVRQRSAGTFVAPAQFPPPWGYEGYAATLDIAAMTQEQYGLVRTYLLRAHQLNPLARLQLAVRLANPLAGVLQHTPPPHLHPEAFLACVAAAWQRAHGGPVPATTWPSPNPYAAGPRPPMPQPVPIPRPLPPPPAPPPVRPPPPPPPPPNWPSG